MSKTKIFIIVIAIAAIGIAAMIIVSSNSPVSPGVSLEVPAEVPQIIEGPGTFDVEGVKYKIIYITNPVDQPISYEILTEKVNKQKLELLVKKIVVDLTETDPALKAFTLNFYSSQSLIDEPKVDVATVNWTPGETIIKMIEENE